LKPCPKGFVYKSIFCWSPEPSAREALPPL
jgi:hypothetical protein